jgi:hypothetical protein
LLADHCLCTKAIQCLPCRHCARLAAYLGRVRGVRTDPEQVAVTAGLLKTA